MINQRVITNMSCIFDRGMGSIDETSYFAEKSHADLVEEFCSYLEMHRLFISNHLEITQALNDRGTDLILNSDNCKLGFQIKSHYDVTENDFAANVKRQQTESLAHGLDKWYLLVCSPLQFRSQDYLGRIQYLLSEISSYKTNYIEVYSPRNAIRFFNKPSPLTEDQFSNKLSDLIPKVQVNFSARYIENCSYGEFYELQVVIQGNQPVNRYKLMFNFPTLDDMNVGYVKPDNQSTERIFIRKQDGYYKVIYNSGGPLFPNIPNDVGEEIGFKYCCRENFRSSMEWDVSWELHTEDGIKLKDRTTIHDLWLSSRH